LQAARPARARERDTSVTSPMTAAAMTRPAPEYPGDGRLCGPDCHGGLLRAVTPLGIEAPDVVHELGGALMAAPARWRTVTQNLRRPATATRATPSRVYAAAAAGSSQHSLRPTSRHQQARRSPRFVTITGGGAVTPQSAAPNGGSRCMRHESRPRSVTACVLHRHPAARSSCARGRRWIVRGCGCAGRGRLRRRGWR
jgi:hypothetical protein